MNALLNHVWGVSLAQDRIWAQVTGLRPREAVSRLLMVLQAFIDESYTAYGTFVMGGYIASAEAWSKFAKEWEELLPFGTLAKNNKHHFKMSEMAVNSERMGRIPAFYRVIERHLPLSLSCRISMPELERAKARVWVENLNIDWGFADNPYSMAFRCLVDMFHNNREAMKAVIPLDQVVDFIFDNRTEKAAILASWDDYLAARPDNIREFYGATPRFEDDQKFLPLQAADFWAWWVREWYEAGTPEKIETQDFGGWKAAREPVGMAISVNEDELVEFFISTVRKMIEPGRPIYDVRFLPHP